MLHLSNNIYNGNEGREIIKINIQHQQETPKRYYDWSDYMGLKPNTSLDTVNLRDAITTDITDNTEKESIVEISHDIEYLADNFFAEVYEQWDEIFPGIMDLDDNNLEMQQNLIKHKSDDEYDLPSHIITNNEKEVKEKHIEETATSSNPHATNKTREYNSENIEKARNERNKRINMAVLFSNLSNLCSGEPCTTKISTLLAAKSECDNLMNLEKRLVVEKERILIINKRLEIRVINMLNEILNLIRLIHK